ncbi:hypothetical protein H4S07_004150, partial [Coemansia furcata]
DTVRTHSCGIHFVVGKKWQVEVAKEKDAAAVASANYNAVLEASKLNSDIA